MTQTQNPQPTTSQDMVDHHAVLSGTNRPDRRPVDRVFSDGELSRQMDEARTNHRLRNRGPILTAVGGAAAALTVGTLAGAGLMNEAGDEQKLTDGEKVGVSVNHELEPGHPSDPITIQAESAVPVTEEPNTAG